ncbi:MAG: hypothetical protein KA369_15935 [Spirochaetes bacterium]|nr:hypothetical protein [Spirochaetota bacterium]
MDKTFEFIFTITDDLLGRIALRMGYPSGSRIDDAAEERIVRACDGLREIIDPRVRCEYDPVAAVDHQAIRGEHVTISSAKLAGMARGTGPDVLICFAMTLGGAVDREIERRLRVSLNDAFIADAAASALLERFAGDFERFLRDEAREGGCVLSARFSPGYCDWDLAEGQEELFAFLDPGSIGIVKNHASAMMPEKSITGLMLRARRLKHLTPCPQCPETGCQYRRMILP